MEIIIIALLLIALVVIIVRYELKIRSLNSNNKQVEDDKVNENDFLHINFRFLENISHELRTPLNGIIGVIDLLKHTKDFDEAQRNIAILENSSKNLLRLVNQIVTVSKLHLNENKNEVSTLNLREFLFELREIFYGKANENLSCTFFVSTELPELISIDHTKLEQLLFELLQNAFKFTDAGEVSLAFRESSSPDKQNCLEIVVKDTGTGIMEQNLSKIFNAFSKNMSMKNDYSGIGLGLSTVKKLLEHMNGTINVNSKYGVGTEFIVELPYEVAETADKQKANLDAEELKVILFMEFSNKNILIQELLSEKDIEFEVVDDLDDLAEADLAESSALIIDAESETRTEIFELIEKKKFAGQTIVFGNSQSDQCAKPNVLCLPKLLRQEQLLDLIFGDQIIIPKIENTEKDNYEFNKIKVAVVEDNKYNLEIIKQMFNFIEADVSYFETGEDFLSDLVNDFFDMIFLDIQLPDMTGFDIISVIRKNERDNSSFQKAFVTALTAHSFDGYKEKCLAAGFDSYLTKPFKMKDLLKELKKMGLKEKSLTQNNSDFEVKSEEIEKVAEFDKDSLKNILLEVYDSDFIQMRDAYLKKDIKSIKYFAHKLKGSFSIAEEKEMAEIFANVENNPESFSIKIIKQIEKNMDGIRVKTYKQS